MIKITIGRYELRVVIPDDLKSEAPRLLKAIWRDEFTGRNWFCLELTERALTFVAEARVTPHILVCQ